MTGATALLDFQKENLLCSQACLNPMCSSRVLFVIEPLLTCGFFSSIELGCLKTQATVTQAEMRGVPQLCRAAVGTKEMSLVPCPMPLDTVCLAFLDTAKAQYTWISRFQKQWHATASKEFVWLGPAIAGIPDPQVWK